LSTVEDRFLELVVKELLDEISPRETDELNSFFSKGNHYKAQYELFQTYWNQQDVDQFTNEQSFQRVKAKIQKYENLESEHTQQVKTVRTFSLITKYWAAAILLITSFSYFLYNRHQSIIENTAVTAYKQKSTSRRQRSLIILTDGTQITLNSESTLKYPAAFAGKTREVYLTGEAFFKVHKDHKHPFIIHTERMNVRVLGTEFNVRSYANDASTETTLIKGSIEITLNNRPADRILLKPKEKLILKNDNVKSLKADFKKNSFTPIKEATQYTLTSLTYLDNKGKAEVVETSWLQNKLVAQNESFEELAQKMERAYGVNIYFTKENVKKLRFTVLFEKENLVQALDALKLTEPFHYRIIKSKVYIN
jgi:transmembrane sensor